MARREAEAVPEAVREAAGVGRWRPGGGAVAVPAGAGVVAAAAGPVAVAEAGGPVGPSRTRLAATRHFVPSQPSPT